jgi:hypothetical protein
MRRLIVSLLTAMTVLALVAGTAMAAVNFHSGPTVTFGTPTATSATLTFNVSGLGSAPASAQIDVVGTAPTTCHNPGNTKAAPGQNPAIAAGSSGSVPLTDSQKNGRDTVSIFATAAATTPTAAQAGCPNKSWTVTVGAITLTSATIDIRYAGVSICSGTFYPDGTSTIVGC